MNKLDYLVSRGRGGRGRYARANARWIGRGGSTPSYTVAELSTLIADAGGSWWRTADTTSMYQGAHSDGGYLLAGDGAASGQPVAQILDIAQFGGLSASAFIAAQSELIANGGMDADSDWGKGTGWGIAAGVATHSGATSGNLTQAVLTQNDWYLTGWTQSADFINVYMGIGTGQVLASNINTAGAHQSIAQSTGALANLAFRTGADGATIDDVSVKKLPGRHAVQTSLANRPTLSANGLMTFDGSDALSANIVSSLGSSCTKITADGSDVTVTEGQTIGAGAYDLPDTGWTDHIILPVSLATAGISESRLRVTLL